MPTPRIKQIRGGMIRFIRSRWLTVLFGQSQGQTTKLILTDHAQDVSATASRGKRNFRRGLSPSATHFDFAPIGPRKDKVGLSFAARYDSAKRSRGCAPSGVVARVGGSLVRAR